MYGEECVHVAVWGPCNKNAIKKLLKQVSHSRLALCRLRLLLPSSSSSLSFVFSVSEGFAEVDD